MRSFFFTWLAVAVGTVLGYVLATYQQPELPPELELKGLRYCIQDNRCYMDPPAYVRYYELKYQLEEGVNRSPRDTDGDRQ